MQNNEQFCLEQPPLPRLLKTTGDKQSERSVEKTVRGLGKHGVGAKPEPTTEVEVVTHVHCRA